MMSLLCALASMPTSFAMEMPLQPVCGSACPVIVKPFNSSLTFGAPMAMQGAPVTVQMTSSTNRLSSVMVRVAEIVPLMSAAYALLPDIATAPRNTGNHVIRFSRRISLSLLTEFLLESQRPSSRHNQIGSHRLSLQSISAAHPWTGQSVCRQLCLEAHAAQ